ncbi:hypothetical protein, partial [Gilvimarinus sp. 1_MG-2023]
MHLTSSRRAGHFDWLKSYHSLMLLPMVTALLLMPFMDGTEVRYWLVFWVLVVVVLTICRAWMMHSNRLHLQQHSGVLQAIFDGLPDGIFFKDRDGVY